MNFGTNPPLSHGSLGTVPLIMPADVATMKTLHEFGPSTVYVHGAIMSFVGYRSFYATRVSLKQMRHAQYERAVLVTLVPKGKRKERSYMETSHASTVIVEGWVEEQLPAPHDPSGTARHLSFDGQWNREFAAWLDAMCRESGRKILADLRGYDAGEARPAATGSMPPPVGPRPAASPAVVPQPILGYVEGTATEIVQTRYERDPAARAACLAHYGLACQVCGFDFGRRFGEFGAGFIHVHHLEQLAITAQEHPVDPVKDLRPVCPNCHAMLHRRRPPLTLEELRAIICTG